MFFISIAIFAEENDSKLSGEFLNNFPNFWKHPFFNMFSSCNKKISSGNSGNFPSSRS